jgi:hypothetical protein
MKYALCASILDPIPNSAVLAAKAGSALQCACYIACHQPDHR